MEVSKIKEGIIKEAKRIEEDCKYSSKSHFNTSSIWSNLHFWIGIPLTILSAISIYNCNIVGLSIAVFILASLQTFISPDRQANLHRITGNSYLSLKNIIRGFREYHILNLNDEISIVEINRLKERLNDLNESSPIPLDFAYKKAKEGIEKNGEATHQVDKED